MICVNIAEQAYVNESKVVGLWLDSQRLSDKTEPCNTYMAYWVVVFITHEIQFRSDKTLNKEEAEKLLESFRHLVDSFNKKNGGNA